MVRNLKIAAAVAAVLSAGSAMATSPTPAQAAAPFLSLYVSGSSAAKNAILGALETNFCSGSYSLFSSTGNTNFFAVSCTPTNAATGISDANGTNVFTIWYRAEGGSVTGALPLVTGKSINQLSLSGAGGSAPNYTVAVTGASATNGIDDSFGGGVFKAPVQLGITDVEPAALVFNNYPSAYLTSVYGHATSTQLANLTATPVFQQVFGIFVNTNSAAFSASEKSGAGNANASLPISKETISNILQGFSTDWSDVPDVNGNVVASSSLGITIINREQGSGSRTATDLFFTNDQCVKGQSPIAESTAGTGDYFSTGNVLAAANGIPGAITYASIDNAGSTYPNLTLVAIDSVVPTNLAAASGSYGDWFEATLVTGPNFSGLSANQKSVISYLQNAFQTEATTPGAVDVLAIPSSSSPPALPISGTASVNGGKTIYVNPFTRGGVSCNDPAITL